MMEKHMSKHGLVGLVLAVGLLAPQIADAHVSISSGPAFANK